MGGKDRGWTRRELLGGIGGGLTLSLAPLGGSVSDGFVNSVRAGQATLDYAGWEDLYRREWRWDGAFWGSHNNQCWPANCLFRVYTRNGVIWREEQAAKAEACSPDYPDYNPLGCQKGCAFHHALTSLERLRYPLRRAGARGEGRWERISWDEALTAIADAILDAHEAASPASFVIDAPHVHGGAVQFAGVARLGAQLGAIMPDTNIAIGDEIKGPTHVFGKMRHGSTSDNHFDAEMIVMTHCNYAYTAPPLWHFVTEARYNGTEIVIVAPDYSPSCVAADIHVPVKVATDAALWLAVAHVLIEEGLYNAAFVREQTDLPFLVITGTGKFLRASDVNGGRADQFYVHDAKQGRIVEAPRGTLAFDGEPDLEGAWTVTLANGGEVTVEPVFARLRRLVAEAYTPEQASAVCGVKPALMRTLARKMATKVTHARIGWTSAKHYHGDLMERALILCLGLTGNWGKPGTGITEFLFTIQHAEIFPLLEKPVAEGGLDDLLAFEHQIGEKMKESDPEVTPEIVSVQAAVEATRMVGVVPPAIWMYHQGYHELWDRREWHDPALHGTFGEYLAEAAEKGAIAPQFLQPLAQDVQVYMMICHNPLRRDRSGRRIYTEKIFPKAKMVFAVETRMSTSAAFADIVLPAAWYYEKDDMTTGVVQNPFNALQQKAVDPPGEAKPEWEIYRLLMERIAVRAAARGMTTFTDNAGAQRAYADIPARFTMHGRLVENKDVVREMLAIDVASGVYPPDFTYEKWAEAGYARVVGMGTGVQRTAPANEMSTDKPFYSFAAHVDDKRPYPTLTRRAQFYMDHDWFLEAGEALPAHKDTPPIGGRHPFRITSGHPRISVHSLHQAVPALMKLHRAQPVVFLNDEKAAELGIADGDTVRVFNDLDSAELMASLSAGVAPDQIVIYMFDAFQFKDWKSHDAMLVGMPKPTHLALDYGQLRFQFLQGSPAPTSDRGLRVGVEKV